MGKTGCFEVYFVFIISAVVFLSSAMIPEYIHICKASDPHIVACINNSVNLLRPRLKKGIPELDVPPLEPLRLDEIKLKRGPSAAAVDCNITNIRVWGPASFIITEMKPDVQKSRFPFRLLLPRLYFKGDYELDMKILVLNVKGKGPIQGNLTNYGADVVMKGRKILKHNQEYLKIDKMHLRLRPGISRIHLSNLFNNDPILSQVSNNIVNDNSELFINEIKPALEHSLAEKFTEIANKITLRFTYKELFPQSTKD